MKSCDMYEHSWIMSAKTAVKELFDCEYCDAELIVPRNIKSTQKPIEKLDIPSHSHDSGPMPLSVEVVDWMQQVTDAINKLQESHAKED